MIEDVGRTPGFVLEEIQGEETQIQAFRADDVDYKTRVVREVQVIYSIATLLKNKALRTSLNNSSEVRYRCCSYTEYFSLMK